MSDQPGARCRKFVDTPGCRSLWSRGWKNYFDDLAENGGMPSIVDQVACNVGRNSGDPRRVAVVFSVTICWS